MPSLHPPRQHPCHVLLSTRSALLQRPAACLPGTPQVDWKLTRGKWRPRLLGFAKDLPAAQVRGLAAVGRPPSAPSTWLKEPSWVLQRRHTRPSHRDPQQLAFACVPSGAARSLPPAPHVVRPAHPLNPPPQASLPRQVEAASQAAFDLLAPHRGGEAPPEAIKAALDALCVLKASPAVQHLMGEAWAAQAGSSRSCAGRRCLRVGTPGQSWRCRATHVALILLACLACRRLAQGVGPATASAVMEAFDPSIPFLSDEAQQAALGTKDYTGGWQDAGAGQAALQKPCCAAEFMVVQQRF